LPFFFATHEHDPTPRVAQPRRQASGFADARVQNGRDGDNESREGRPGIHHHRNGVGCDMTLEAGFVRFDRMAVGQRLVAFAAFGLAAGASGRFVTPRRTAH
jgi:hypothetical protein